LVLARGRRNEMNQQALSGIKVLELSDFISGPYCSKLLADMGAEVIKVEAPGLGDKSRSWGPFPQDLPDPEKSGLFLFLNTDKDSITLNLETARGMMIFKELLKWADILVESNAVKEMSRLGLSFSKLHRLFPGLIVTSITPFGQTGPWRDYKGCDLVNSHVSTEAFGNPAEGADDADNMPPIKGPMHAADFMPGLTASIGTLSAVIARQSSGLGQHLDISQQEALASVCRQELAFYTIEGSIPIRQKGRKRRGGILYHCKDGWVCIWIGPHYPKVVQMLGDPDWMKIDLFQNPDTRLDHMEEFNQLMSVWTIDKTMEEIDKLAIQYSVPCSPVRSVKDVVNDVQLEYRRFWVDLEHPVAGKMRYPGAPFQMSATPWKARRAAPLLGQHNEKVYCQMLGYSREDLVRMRQAGII
jgi:CoA:oxalate CoA-transferase